MNSASSDTESAKTEPRRRPATVRNWIGMAVVVLLVMGYLQMISGGGRDAGKSHAAVGSPLLQLDLAPLTGDSDKVDLKGLAGKITLVNYWGVWCPPCREEFPHLQKLEEKFASNDDFRFLSVSCGSTQEEDPDELRDQTARFMSGMGARFPTYHDPGMESRIALVRGADLRGFGYPTTILLDRNGIIRGLWSGYTPGYETEMSQMVADLLAAPDNDAP